MTAPRDLSRLLRPKSIAVVGGGFFAPNVVRQSVKMGFAGAIWPVHPTKNEVAGVRAYRSLAELPHAPDATFIGVNRNLSIDVVRELKQRGAGGAICFAAGFRETAHYDADGSSLQDALLDAAGAMPVIGPNCYGLINYADGALLWPAQHGGRRLAEGERGAAIITQSSNIACNLTMQTRGLPVAFLMTAGNQAQTGISEMALGLIEDERVSCLGLHIEGFDSAAGFERLARRARSLGKPIVAMKVGRSEAARAATVSHTASLAGSDAASDAFLRRLGIPRVDRYSQTRQTIVVPRGNRYGALILATRADVGGPIELLPLNLIPGVTMTSRPMHAGMNLMPVVFEAKEDAPVDGDLIDFRAKLADEKQVPLEGGFENVAEFVRGEPNNNIYINGIVHKLAMAVGEKVPYHLEVAQPKVPLVRAGTMNLKVLVKRAEGFDAPLTVQFPFNPPGVGAAGTITIEKGKSEGVYPLNANAGAMVGKWPMMVIGAADIDGEAWVSSQLAELEIAERYVAFDMKRTACDKGQAAQIQCELDQNTPFEGNAKAELLGLPPGASADPIDFRKETKELAFEIKTTKDTPVGNHKSLFCQVTIIQNGEPIVFNAGTTVLRVNELDAKSVVAASGKVEKPMSRLQQLRARMLSTEAKKP